MPPLPTNLHPGSSRLRRARQWAAAIAAAGFLAVSVAAPLPFLNSPVDDGTRSSEFTAFQALGQQALTSASGLEPAIDLSASEVSEVSAVGAPLTGAEFSLNDFLFRGVINWGGYKFTFYSQQVLPGGGLNIPGRHVNEGGYVSDSDGYIVLAGSAPKGTVYDTPFGYQGKIYDRGTVGNHLDVYIR